MEHKNEEMKCDPQNGTNEIMKMVNAKPAVPQIKQKLIEKEQKHHNKCILL